MKFSSPGGTRGVFTTIRLGKQWFDDVSEGQEIALEDVDGKIFGYAKVLDKCTIEVARVPASLLEISHDPLFRTYSGAIMGLRSLYREDITPNDVVSVVILEFLRETKLVL